MVAFDIAVWCLVGNGGMDPYSSPYILPKNSPHNPFPHSLLSTRQIECCRGHNDLAGTVAR